MGRISGSVSQRGDSYSFYIDWLESSVNQSSNTSVVTATAYIYCSAHTAYENNLAQSLTIDGTTFNDTKNISLSSGVTVALVTGSKTITHNTDGSRSITISANCDLPNGAGWGPNWGSASGTVSLTKIPRYAEINSAYVESTTLTTATIRYSVSKNADIYCSTDNQAWGSAKVNNTISGTFTITNLNPNVQHSFRIMAKAKDSGLERTSSYFYGTTKDYARITSVDNSNYSENVNMTISNLANGTVKLKVKIGDVEICERSNLTASYTLVFTKDELSKIIKLLKNENTQVTYIVITDNTYQASKQALIILKTNAYLKIDGIWKKVRIFIKINGRWHKVKIYIKIDGEWRNTA